MFSSSSAAQFTSSSSATAPSAAVDSTPDVPSTGLGARTATPVPVQQQARERKSWSSAAEAHFAALPREVLEIIAADASDTLEEAQALLGALAQVQQVDDKVARAWAFDPVSQKRMQKENPRLGPLGKLLREFSPSADLEKFFPTIDDAREVLRRQARAKDYSQAEIDAWLASDDTLIQLMEKENRWLRETPPGEGSGVVALYFMERGYPLRNVPTHLRSYRVCLEATSGPRSGPDRLHYVPAAHRTPELVRAAVSKHPDAMRFLEDEQRTIDLYELAGSQLDLERFRELPVTQQVAADPRYQAVLERLQKQV